MISRQLKRTFYACTGPLMWLNGLRHRRFPSSKGHPVRVHLGPGQRKYLEGWVNVDANLFTARLDIWANLNDGLPFPNNSIDALYSHHVIEHLPDLGRHFHEAFRCMKPGGVFRIGGPNADAAIRKYIEGDYSWFSDFPDARHSIGGRLDNFLYCRHEHLALLTPSYLEELATAAGFHSVRRVVPVTETSYPDLFDAAVLKGEWEDSPTMPHTLLMEGRRPSQG